MRAKGFQTDSVDGVGVASAVESIELPNDGLLRSRRWGVLVWVAGASVLALCCTTPTEVSTERKQLAELNRKVEELQNAISRDHGTRDNEGAPHTRPSIDQPTPHAAESIDSQHRPGSIQDLARNISVQIVDQDISGTITMDRNARSITAYITDFGAPSQRIVAVLLVDVITVVVAGESRRLAFVPSAVALDAERTVLVAGHTENNEWGILARTVLQRPDPDALPSQQSWSWSELKTQFQDTVITSPSCIAVVPTQPGLYATTTNEGYLGLIDTQNGTVQLLATPATVPELVGETALSVGAPDEQSTSAKANAFHIVVKRVVADSTSSNIVCFAYDNNGDRRIEEAIRWSQERREWLNIPLE